MNLQSYLPQHLPDQVKNAPASHFKILIVDDEEMTRDTLQAMLESPQFTIQKAVCGEDALVRASAFEPDLILLDIELHQGMNGIQTCKALKQLPQTSDVPVVFVTGRSDLVPPAFAAGGSDYINKPVHLQELHARVNCQLKIRQLMMTLRMLNEYYEERLNQLEYAMLV
jgi:DNA-binding response OmpR family regulator